MTKGVHHVGLAVLDLSVTTAFFTDALGWKLLDRDEGYPRAIVSDGHVMVTLWQVDRALDVQPFDRRRNVGLHHLALLVETEAELTALAAKLAATPGVRIEFPPEPLGQTPRRHMMVYEPGGIRLEFLWAGA
jgi:lactoylglutathione lyase